MKEKIITKLGEDAAKRVASKIEERGWLGAYDTAVETARTELGKDATEEALVERAAIRVQQLVGCIPRKPAGGPVPILQHDSAEAAKSSPPLVLPPVPKGKKAETAADTAGAETKAD